MLSTMLGELLRIPYYLLVIYYLIIIIYFILTWIRPLYGTKFFYIMERITSPFMRLCSGKLIVGMLDLGSTIGIIVYGLLLRILENIIYYI